MLFSKIGRDFLGPKPHAEAEFDYLDRSARPEGEVVREVLERWFARYPEEDRADLRGRFRSQIDVQHISAAFELYLHELFLNLGYAVQVHPITPNNKSTRPDFLLVDAEGRRVYVEAVQSSDVSVDERAAQARLNVVFDEINRLEVYGWFLGVDSRSYPEKPPSAKKLKSRLQEWLSGLSYDQVVESVERNGRRDFPTLDYADGEWNLQFTAFPRSPEKRDKPVRGVLGAFFGGARWLSTWQDIRDTLVYKASRYGKLDAPLLIAVNANVVDLDEIDVMEALFGQEQYVVDPRDMDREPEMVRAKNGFWYGPKGTQHTHVAGILIGRDVKPWTYGVRSLTLCHNPWAVTEIVGPICTLPRKVPIEGQMQTVAGSSSKNILRLPDGYPGV